MADIYERQYTQRIKWENSASTPVEAENLNKIDEGMRRVDAELSAAIEYCFGLIKSKGWYHGNIV